MILKQGHTYRAMPHDGKVIDRIYRGGRCYYIASPYSHEATQALRAAFPQYWTAIRDYGWANPALVPFVNEDPMLIVSLVEVGKTRWLTIRNDATYGYANGLVLDVELKDIDIIKTCVQKIDGNNWIILSKFSGSGATNPAFGRDFNDMGVTYTANPNPWDAMAVTELELTINRTDAAKTWWGSFINSSWSRNFRTKYIEIISKSGERVLYLVPFTREGKTYMLNLDTFELLTNYINNDSFTIQITDKE